MTATRLLATAAALVTLSACFENRALEVRTISLDHLTGVQAEELAIPYLSKEGQVFRSKEVFNAITVRDHSRNVERIRDMLSSRDASPANVALQFQLIRATQAGEVGPGLERIADALGELLRFRGYEMMSEAVVSASESGMVEQSLDGGGMPLQLGVRINDVRGYGSDGSVELTVELRRPGGALLSTNVVVPMEQTVVLGSAYPGSNGNALILTVRGEMGSQKLRSASRSRRSGRDEAYMKAHADAMEAEAAAEAAAVEAELVEAKRLEVHIEPAVAPHGTDTRRARTPVKSGRAIIVTPATPAATTAPARATLPPPPPAR